MIHLKLSNIKIPVGNEKNIKNLVCKQFKIRTEDLSGFRIVRQSVDARKKNNVLYNFQVEVTIPDQYRSLLKGSDAAECVPVQELSYPKWAHDLPPVVVGFGPAGMIQFLDGREGDPCFEIGQDLFQRFEGIRAVILGDDHFFCNSNLVFRKFPIIFQTPPQDFDFFNGVEVVEEFGPLR